MTEPAFKSPKQMRAETEALRASPAYAAEQAEIAARDAEVRSRKERALASLDARASLLRLTVQQQAECARLRGVYFDSHRRDDMTLAYAAYELWIQRREIDVRSAPLPGAVPVIVEQPVIEAPAVTVDTSVAGTVARQKRMARHREAGRRLERFDEDVARDAWRLHDAAMSADFFEASIVALETAIEKLQEQSPTTVESVEPRPPVALAGEAMVGVPSSVVTAEPPEPPAGVDGMCEAVAADVPAGISARVWTAVTSMLEKLGRPATESAVRAELANGAFPPEERERIRQELKARGKPATNRAIEREWQRIRNES